MSKIFYRLKGLTSKVTKLKTMNTFFTDFNDHLSKLMILSFIFSNDDKNNSNTYNKFTVFV